MLDEILRKLKIMLDEANKAHNEPFQTDAESSYDFGRVMALEDVIDFIEKIIELKK